MKTLDSKKIAGVILRKIRKEIENRNKRLVLAVVQVGGNSVNKSYLRQKRLASEKANVDFSLFRFPADAKEEILIKEITGLAKDKNVFGIVIQLPLPKTINSRKILNLIPLEKDPDCLSDTAFGRFCGNEPLILPPIVGAVKYFLDERKTDVQGKNEKKYD